MYPLRFRPIFKQYLWGGRRLGSLLNKPIGPSGPYAESWEIVDRNEFQSEIINGPLAGSTLGDLTRRRGPELLGEQVWDQATDALLADSLRGRFPLLLKFLDASQPLSVQVHPDDHLAALLEPPDLGKTEAWLVLDAAVDSQIFAGLQPGVGPDELADHIQRGQIQQVLHSFAPRPGDCVLIPAGTVHAIGGGILILEVQQSSDTTYRLYDWQRVDAQGQARPLHVDEAVHATNYRQGPILPNRSPAVPGETSTRLVRCDKFVIDRQLIDRPWTLSTRGSVHLLAVIEGAVVVEGEPSGLPLRKGDTALIPAAMQTATLQPQPHVEVIDIFVPGVC